MYINMLCKLRSCGIYSSFQKRKLSSATTRLIVRDGIYPNAYKPSNVEKNKYETWEKDGRYSPSFPTIKSRFGMVLPPPNVTGKLHLGHALGCSIQDVMMRRSRSLGYNTLWVPGVDHAGIATQNVVEKYLKSTQNLNRQDMGKEEFNKAVLHWKEEHHKTIKEQLKRLGCSLDWSREVFTMDTRSSLAVSSAFIRLFNKGLIYRKKGLVNWCPELQSTVSDIEIDHVPIKGVTKMTVPGYAKPVKMGLLYNFAYKIFGTDEELVVSTTKPETMLGDVAVAVHPDDNRYQNLRGKRLYHPFQEYTIPIVFDKAVDMKFGTGAVKVTPAHSKVDYEIAKRNNLPIKQVIDEKGLMIGVGEFSEIHKYLCREKIIKKLDNIGFLREVKPHDMVIPVCSRTGDIIEYLLKPQWYVACKKMNEKARAAVCSGLVSIKPEKYLQNWLQWTKEDNDWCISRQLWWGHPIPAYKCMVGKMAVWVAATGEEQARQEASKILRTFTKDIEVERDTDVLDTWFSSAIYPFAALGWPEKTKEICNFYPLSALVTGHDILGFWVHRMIMLGIELTDTVPFTDVLLHGVICDSNGAKMSKSKGNVIDPMDVIQGMNMDSLGNKAKEMHRIGILTKTELDKALAYHKSNFSNTNGIPECGADALRFTLLSQDIKSHFVNFDVKMCYANKLFCNKIWQALRYTQMNINKLKYSFAAVTPHDLTYFDRWILSRLSDMVTKVNKHIEEYDFHLATRALRSHIYKELCDVYIEATKAGFGENNYRTSYAHAHTLSAVLNTSLRCLHPFMVYLTQELIPRIPSYERNIICNYDDIHKKCFNFPLGQDFECWQDDDLEKKVSKMLDVATLVREIKSLCGMGNAVRPAMRMVTPNDKFKSDVVANLPVVLNLARCGTLEFTQSHEEETHNDSKYVRAILDSETEIFVEVLGTDYKYAIMAVKTQLEKNIEKLSNIVLHLENKYASAHYLKSTPEWTKVVDTEKLMYKQEKLKKLRSDLRRIYPCENDSNATLSHAKPIVKADILKH